MLLASCKLGFLTIVRTEGEPMSGKQNITAKVYSHILIRPLGASLEPSYDLDSLKGQVSTVAFPVEAS